MLVLPDTTMSTAASSSVLLHVHRGDWALEDLHVDMVACGGGMREGRKG